MARLTHEERKAEALERNKASILQVQELVGSLSRDYKLSKQEVQSLLSDHTPHIGIPVSILSHETGPLESIVKYLHENHGLTYSKIAKLLGRDPRTVWVTYHKAQEKLSQRFRPKPGDILVPISLLKVRKFSILESVVFFLREQKMMHLTAVAKLLNKNTSTIWTAYNRHKKKD